MFFDEIADVRFFAKGSPNSQAGPNTNGISLLRPSGVNIKFAFTPRTLCIFRVGDLAATGGRSARDIRESSVISSRHSHAMVVAASCIDELLRYHRYKTIFHFYHWVRYPTSGSTSLLQTMSCGHPIGVFPLIGERGGQKLCRLTCKNK